MTASNALSSIAADFATGIDPALLARHCFGIEELDGWQRELLYSTDPYTIVLKGRQIGCSTVLSMKAMHLALNKPRSLTLLVSPTQRQSQELFYKAVNLYKSLGKPVGASAENKLSLKLMNDSRIVSLPGSPDNIRGYSSPDLIIVDEAASIPSDELYYGAVSPMCSTGGTQLILASTARGRRGFFYHVWEEGGPEWVRHRIPSTECKRISAKFLEKERRELGEFFYKSEYLCSFESNIYSVFNSELVQQAISDDVDELDLDLTDVEKCKPLKLDIELSEEDNDDDV